jgi:hypothetical protein
MTDTARKPGRPRKVLESAIIVPTSEPEQIKTPVLVKYYHMNVEHIAAGQPGNIEAVNKLSPNDQGLISEIDLLAGGVDLKWLIDAEVIEEYGYLPA